MVKKNQISKQLGNKEPGGVFFQPKLAIGQPGNTYEEADAMADNVMQMKKTFPGRIFILPATVQKKCAAGGEKKIQRADDKKRVMDDVTFETETDVGAGLLNNTLTPDPIMGKTYTASCNAYSVSFKFVKAYKGTYPSTASPLTGYLKGVYVQIEASYKNAASPGLCRKLRLIQVLRYFTKGEKGEVRTASPTNEVRGERAAFNTNKPSAGWMVDAGNTATDPYYTASAWANEGSENTPATLWDAPGFIDAKNHGKEFYTCAVCEGGPDNKRWMPACIKWGYYIDNNRNINFHPQAPEAICNYPAEVKNATDRWDAIPGNVPAGITF